MLSMIVVSLYYIYILSGENGAWNDINNPMKLLAVSNLSTNKTGSIAYLYLNTEQGSGNMFIESYPLTKIDTQISTKLARDIACDYVEANCNNKDFFYKIQAGTSIIGGPSAGAAIATLTAANLKDITLPDTVAITGTISSSGIIGSVGGIPEKIVAAGQRDVTKVLVPFNQLQYKEVNRTVDLKALGEEIGVEVVGVQTLYDALDEFTKGTDDYDRLKRVINTKYQPTTPPIPVDENYRHIMDTIETNLCTRTTELIDSIDTILRPYSLAIDNENGTETNTTTLSYALINTTKNTSITNETLAQQNVSETLQNELARLIKNLAIIEESKTKANRLHTENKSYSASSFCYSANVILKEHQLALTNVTTIGNEKTFFRTYYRSLLKRYVNMSKRLTQHPKNTITELESYVIVKERILDGIDNLGITIDEFNTLTLPYTNTTSEMIKDYASQNAKQQYLNPRDLARASERLISAENWIMFYDMKTKDIPINNKILEESCQEKISEVTELYQYLVSEFPLTLQDISTEIDELNSFLATKSYDVCFFRGMHIKARLNSVLSLLYNSDVEALIKQNLNVADDIIAGQQKNDLFPILGYSYYEYANTLLGENDPSSALYYASIALEISNIDLYLQTEQSPFFFDKDRFFSLMIGIIIGINIFLLISQLLFDSENEKRPPTRKSPVTEDDSTKEKSTSTQVPKIERIEIKQ